MLRRTALLLLTLVGFTAPALAPASASAASAPPGMFALGDWAWPTVAALDREGPRGVRSWRVPLDFAVIGRTAGTYDWGGFDGLVRDTGQRSISPLFVLKGCPTRLCPSSPVPSGGIALTEWKAFVTAAVKRYGTGGTFWAANPTLTPRPITLWQVMNEVNGADEWPSPNAAAYASFFVTTSQALKAADPAAKAVVAGLPEIMTIWMKDFLPALYAQPGFKAAVDVIAIHGYAPSPSATAKVLDTARAVMLNNGDGAKPIWVTEFAWATSGLAGDPFVVSDATQATYLREAGDLMVACAARWNLQRAYWFGWKDPKAAGDGYWGYHVGLHRADGTAKPALTAFDEFTSGAVLPNGRASTCPLGGGTTFDLTVPETTITAGPGVRTADPRPAYTFAASEPSVRFECSMDGAAWATCTPDATGAWRPTVAMTDGSHTLRVRAIDGFGNVDQTPAANTTIYDRYPADTYISGTRGLVSSTVVSLALSASEPVLRYECRVDAGAWAACPSAYTTTLSAGEHWIYVRSIDLAGNVDPDPATAWFNVRPA